MKKMVLILAGLVVLSLQAQNPPAAAPATPAPDAASAIIPAQDPRADALTKMLNTESQGNASVQAAILRAKDKDQALESMVGGFATTYAVFTVLFYSDFPELAAPVRTFDPEPTIWVKSPGSPRGKIFLVRVEVNKRKGNRSLKMGNSGYASVSSISTPDQDWVVPSSTKEVQPGVWEFRPLKPLKPGEYGVFATLATGTMPGGMGGQLYDFGVDKP